MKATFLAVAWMLTVLAGCAGPATTWPVLAVRCPVSDINTARGIATVAIAQNADADHVNQAGYRLDISDEGQFWLAHDGPNLVRQGDTIAVQAGGSAIQFRIAKCSGAVSDFSQHVWR
jgi:hypothetical protein